MVLLVLTTVSLTYAFYFTNAQATSSGTQKVTVSSDVSKSVTDHIFFQLYTGSTNKDYVRIRFEDGLTFSKYDGFDSTKQTDFYYPGWGEKPDQNAESINEIAAAYTKTKIANLVVIDYSELVSSEQTVYYVGAVINGSQIGEALGQFLKKYVSSVQSLDLIHLVSHSLGSHIMSKSANTYGKGELPWLTALDPAGPLFNIPIANFGLTSYHLDESDAVFVDVIHTDGNFYGDFKSIGTVDCYPNKGTRVQPYCARNSSNTDGICSHRMSWRYYAESILYMLGFLADKCSDKIACTSRIPIVDRACNCDKNDVTVMGYGVDKKARGDYYLKTAASSPFGLGQEGLIE